MGFLPRQPKRYEQRILFNVQPFPGYNNGNRDFHFGKDFPEGGYAEKTVFSICLGSCAPCARRNIPHRQLLRVSLLPAQL